MRNNALPVSFRLAPAFGEKRGHALARKLVGALVLVMAVMALHPMPAHLVPLGGLLEPLPQLDIADRLLVGGPPAVPLPALDPARDAAAEVVRVGVKVDVGGDFSASSAEIAAISSMRLLVVSSSPPFSSLRCWPACKMAPQPPGPGLPEQAPSVWITTFGLSLNVSMLPEPVVAIRLHLAMESRACADIRSGPSA